MKKFFLSTVTCLLLCLPAFAIDVEVPVNRIQGLEKVVPLGDVVRLNLSKVEAAPKHYHSRSMDWRIWDGDKEKSFFPDGEGIILGTGVVDKEYKVLVSVSYLYLIKNGDVITGVEVRSRLIVDKLRVGSDKPLPPPIPVPVVFPDGRYKLSLLTYKAASNVGGDRATMAQALAKNYDAMISRIAAGTVLNLKAALEEVTNDNKTTLGTSSALWDSFFVTLQDATYTLYNDRKMVTAADFQDACREISAGLKAVK